MAKPESKRNDNWVDESKGLRVEPSPEGDDRAWSRRSVVPSELAPVRPINPELRHWAIVAISLRRNNAVVQERTEKIENGK